MSQVSESQFNNGGLTRTGQVNERAQMPDGLQRETEGFGSFWHTRPEPPERADMTGLTIFALIVSRMYCKCQYGAIAQKKITPLSVGGGL